jgi:formate/nitrite transporter FocA (FNT family)
LRTKAALWWSALGAGLSIGFSLLAQAMLKAYLPASPGAWIVEALGYSAGFLIVILSRQQLFTENMLTAVLPVSSNWCG